MEYRYRDASEMKDSGVEWIGKIPKDWDVSKFKYVSLLYTGNSIKDSEKDNYSSNENAYPYIGTKDIISDYNEINYNNGMYTKVDDNKFRVAEKGSTLICIEGGSAGKKLSYLNQRVSFVNKLCCIQSNKIYSKFQYYYCNCDSFKKEFSLNLSGLIGGVSINSLNNFRLVKPSLYEQKKIADFLDKKTSQFDSIISKKESLIEKLEEAKKSLISEVVTGKVKVVKTDDGYELVKRNSDEMKDSGVEWLGEIPKDWNCTKLKNICNNITDGAHISPETKNGVYPFISVKDLNEDGLDFNNCLLTSIENYMYLKNNSCNPSVNDILISKDGTIGKTTTINYDKEFVVASSLVILTPSSDYKSEYVEYILNSNFVQKQIRKYVKGTALPRISIMHLKDIILPYTLDKNEQELMITYLKEKNVLIKALIQKTKQQIEKLKEAKQSLISEAVTGKIEILD